MFEVSRLVVYDIWSTQFCKIAEVKLEHLSCKLVFLLMS